MLKTKEALAFSRQTGEVYISRFSHKRKRTDWSFHHPNTDFYLIPYLQGDEWCVELLTLHKGSNANDKATICPGTMKLKNGCPFTFDVEVTSGNKKTVYSLFHNHRASIKGLHENRVVTLIGGYANSFFVSLMGPMSAGKTVFQHALRTRKVCNSLAELVGCNVQCHMTSDYADKYASSPINTFSMEPISFCKPVTGDTIAEVYLVDTAGELLSGKFWETDGETKLDPADRLAMEQVIRNTSMMDTVFLITKGSSLLKGGEGAGEINMASNIFCRLKPQTLMAHIITEGNKLRQAAEVAANTGSGSPFRGNALFMPNSALFEPVTTEEEVYRHTAIATTFYTDVANVNQRVPCPTFLVDSLTEKDGELDFSTAFNVEIPIAWVATQVTASIKLH